MSPSAIHRKLINLAAEAIRSLLGQKGANSISEEDIRAALMGGDVAPRTVCLKKETIGRTDIVVESLQDKELLIRYELKSFFKDNEIPYNYISEILKDIRKLHVKKSNESCYFIFVCLDSHLDLVPERNKERIESQMSFIREFPESSINTRFTVDEERIQIIKAHGVIYDGFVIYTWKVL